MNTLNETTNEVVTNEVVTNEVVTNEVITNEVVFTHTALDEVASQRNKYKIRLTPDIWDVLKEKCADALPPSMNGYRMAFTKEELMAIIAILPDPFITFETIKGVDGRMGRLYKMDVPIFDYVPKDGEIMELNLNGYNLAILALRTPNILGAFIANDLKANTDANATTDANANANATNKTPPKKEEGVKVVIVKREDILFDPNTEVEMFDSIDISNPPMEAKGLIRVINADGTIFFECFSRRGVQCQGTWIEISINWGYSQDETKVLMWKHYKLQLDRKSTVTDLAKYAGMFTKGTDRRPFIDYPDKVK